MPKHIRIRTKVGTDKEVTVNLNQDFDMLEILSLNMHQTDVYRRDCSDFGVVVGRVIANGGFGVPNAKVSVFLPLEDEDEENEVIKQLYPYTSSSIRNDDGYVYNLLPQDPSYTGHLPTGSLPKVSEVLLNQEVSYVYKKYYKLSAKTNESGDFMIYGVPPGSQRLVMNLDLSDMGCFSMVPEDFKLQGVSESKFDGARFLAANDLGSLPQIVQTQKQVEVKPFWGDDEAGCDASITRVDFDLRDLGVEIKPTAVFMGSLGSDTHKDSVNKNCRPRWGQGDLCYVEPQQGTIESIRWTPFFKEEVAPVGVNAGQTEMVPVFERYNIDGGQTINEDGSFLINVPMNIDFLITNEFGEQVISKDPQKGIPTKGKYRFRIKPLNTTGTARLRRRGAFLVPNIREWNNNDGSGTLSKEPGDQYGTGPGLPGEEKFRSYAFSVDYYDYPIDAIDSGLLLTCQDYFYEFSFGKVYTVSQFHNFWKHRHRDGFIGIKEIMPREEKRCERVPFPVNTASRNINFSIIINQVLTRFIQVHWQFTWSLMNILCLIIPIFAIIINIIGIVVGGILDIVSAILSWFGVSWTAPNFPILPLGCEDLFPCIKLRVTKYPECQKCGCTPDSMACTSSGDCQGPMDEPDLDPNNPNDAGDDDYIECLGPDDEVGGTTYGIDGCYLINFTSIIGTLLNGGWSNFSVPMRWRRMEVTFRSMCDGLFNYFWQNNWVNGFLYAFQFKAKLKPDDDYPNGYRAKYCAETMHFDPVMQEFYYRSCPTKSIFNFHGDPDTALRSNNNVGGFLGLFTLKGENQRNVHFPTTIMELGPIQEYIGEICSMKGYREGCSVSDDLDSTTFSEPGDIIFDGVSQRIVQYGNWDGWGLGKMFPRDHKMVGGDMASIFSQFSETGVLAYEDFTNSDLDLLSDPAGNQMGTPLQDACLDLLGASYAPPGWWTSPSGQYPDIGSCVTSTNIPGSINTPAPSVGSWPDYSLSSPSADIITLNPRILYPADIPIPTVAVSPGSEIRQCLVRFLSGSTQTIPLYLWKTDATSLGGGSFTGEQAEWETDDIIPIQYQNQDTWGYPTTPLYDVDPSTEAEVILGTGYHFYFGLIPGATSYDIFVEKYVPLPQDPLEEDELFVI